MASPHLKAVVVGDGGCGKTSLLHVFSKGIFPEVCLHLNAVVKEFGLSTGESHRNVPIDNKRQDDGHYDPCASGTSVVDFNIDGKVVLRLGYGRTRTLRPTSALSYPETDVFLICFAIDWVETLGSVQEKWIAEVQHFCPCIPIILVGCKTDLRYGEKISEKFGKTSQTVVTMELGEAVRKKIRAHRYIECSAKYNQGVSQV